MPFMMSAWAGSIPVAESENQIPADMEAFVYVSGQSDNEEANEIRNRIIEMAKDALYERYSVDDYRFTVKSRWIPRSILNLSDSQLIEIEPEVPVNRYTIFNLSFRENGAIHSAQVQFVVETEKRLPVAIARIPSGSRMMTDMIEYRWVSAPAGGNQLVESKEDLIGKQLRRTLAAGQPVRYADITGGYLIEAGEEALLKFNQAGVQIELQVYARESGGQDEEIIFYSEETRNRYLGKITGPGVAKWKRTF